MYQIEDDFMTEEECREHQLRFEITKVEMRNTREQIEIWEYDRKILDAEHGLAMRKLENQRMETDRCSCKDIFVKLCRLVDSQAMKEKWEKINEIITKYNKDVKTEIEKQTEIRIQQIKVKYAVLRENFESLKVVKTLRAAEKELSNLNEKHAQLQAEFKSLKEEELKNKIALDEIYQNFIIKSVEFNKYITESAQEILELQTTYYDTQGQITNFKELKSKLINEIAIVQKEYDIKRAEHEKTSSMTPKFIKKIFLPEDFTSKPLNKFSVANTDGSIANKKRKIEIIEDILIKPCEAMASRRNEKAYKSLQFNENVKVDNMSCEYDKSDQSMPFVNKSTNQQQFFATSSKHNNKEISINTTQIKNENLKTQNQTNQQKLSTSSQIFKNKEILKLPKIENENISFSNKEKLPVKIENSIILSQENFNKLYGSAKVDQKYYKIKTDQKMLEKMDLDSVTESTSFSQSNTKLKSTVTKENFADPQNEDHFKTDKTTSKGKFSENNFNKTYKSSEHTKLSVQPSGGKEEKSLQVLKNFVDSENDDLSKTDKTSSKRKMSENDFHKTYKSSGNTKIFQQLDNEEKPLQVLENFADSENDDHSKTDQTSSKRKISENDFHKTYKSSGNTKIFQQLDNEEKPLQVLENFDDSENDDHSKTDQTSSKRKISENDFHKTYKPSGNKKIFQQPDNEEKPLQVLENFDDSENDDQSKTDQTSSKRNIFENDFHKTYKPSGNKKIFQQPDNEEKPLQVLENFDDSENDDQSKTDQTSKRKISENDFHKTYKPSGNRNIFLQPDNQQKPLQVLENFDDSENDDQSKTDQTSSKRKISENDFHKTYKPSENTKIFPPPQNEEKPLQSLSNFDDSENDDHSKITSKCKMSENFFDKTNQSLAETKSSQQPENKEKDLKSLNPSGVISDTFMNFNPDDDFKNFMLDEPSRNDPWNGDVNPTKMDDSDGFLEQNNNDSFDFFDEANNNQDGSFF